jgi:hypothetical protein
LNFFSLELRWFYIDGEVASVRFPKYDEPICPIDPAFLYTVN